MNLRDPGLTAATFIGALLTAATLQIRPVQTAPAAAAFCEGLTNSVTREVGKSAVGKAIQL